MSKWISIEEKVSAIKEEKNNVIFKKGKRTYDPSIKKYLHQIESTIEVSMPILEYPCSNIVNITILGDPCSDLSANRAPGSGSYYGIKGSSPKNLMMRWQRLRKMWEKRSIDTWIAHGKPRFIEPIQICFHIARARIVDPDNALYAYKKIIDGMCNKKLLGEVGLVPDDSAKWIRYAPVQFSTGHMHRLNPYTLIVICPTRIADEIIRQHLNKQKEIKDAISGDSK